MTTKPPIDWSAKTNTIPFSRDVKVVDDDYREIETIPEKAPTDVLKAFADMQAVVNTIAYDVKSLRLCEESNRAAIMAQLSIIAMIPGIVEAVEKKMADLDPNVGDDVLARRLDVHEMLEAAKLLRDNFWK